MSRRRVHPLALVLATGVAANVVCNSAGAQHCKFTETEWLEAPDAQRSAHFGEAVAIEGDRAFVGAPGDYDGNPGDPTGSVYAYERIAGTWTFTQKLRPSAPRGDGLGNVLAFHGDVLVAGGVITDSSTGAVYVFRFDGTQWLEEQRLEAPQSSASFGASLDVHDGRIAISAYGDDQVHLFEHDGTQWTLVQTLDRAGRAGQLFGRSVAIDGDALLVAAMEGDDGNGAAFLYRHDGSAFVLEDRLVPAAIDDVRLYGFAVDLDGDRAAVSALVHEHSASSGSVFTFRDHGRRWREEATHFTFNADGLGTSIALDTPWLFAGSLTGGPDRSGGTHGYRFDGSTFGVHSSLYASDGEVGMNLGWSTSFDNGTLWAGAPSHDTAAGTYAGAVYVYEVPDLALDANHHTRSEGDRLNITTAGGMLGSPSHLFAIDVGGTPTFLPVARGIFEDPHRYWNLVATVPPGLTGLDITFQSLGFLDPLTLGHSNSIVVTFE